MPIVGLEESEITVSEEDGMASVCVSAMDIGSAVISVMITDVTITAQGTMECHRYYIGQLFRGHSTVLKLIYLKPL